MEFASFEGPRQVPSGIHGLKIPATAALQPTQADFLLVPGAAGPVSGDRPDSIPALLSRAVASGLPDVLHKAMARPDLTMAIQFERRGTVWRVQGTEPLPW